MKRLIVTAADGRKLIINPEFYDYVIEITPWVMVPQPVIDSAGGDRAKIQTLLCSSSNDDNQLYIQETIAYVHNALMLMKGCDIK